MSRWLPVPPPDRWRHDPQRLRALLAEYELSGSQAGALIGVDGRTMRRWTAIAEDVQRSEMPWSAWYALVHEVTRLAELER